MHQAVLGTTQQYIQCGPLSVGVQLQRIPFTHVSQVKPILQILRQQLAFNELFTSCFKKTGTSQQGTQVLS